MRFFDKSHLWFSKSLANQLLFTYLLVIAFALGVVSFWALFTIKHESVRDLRNSLEVEAVHLALEIDNDLQLDSDEASSRIQNAVDRHASRLGLSITVVNKNGHVLAESGQPLLPEGENISNQPEINDALSGIAAFYQRNSARTRTEWLYVAYPVRASGETAGVIRVGVPMTDIDTRLNRDLIIFLEIIAATVVATALISLWLARRVTKPISAMSEECRSIARSGDINATVRLYRQDEIGEFVASFNQMISRLREEERLRQEFIANASHELKTPTMAIGSVVEALQAGAVEDPQLRGQFLKSLENLVERQENLISDLLDVARLDAEKSLEWHDAVNLLDSIMEAVEQVRSQAQKKAVNINVEADLNGQIVEGNSIQLQRAFINLLTNAINYTPSAGTVTVKVERLDADLAELRFSDTGPGIETDDLPHIFERFYRADKARSRASGGTGLGLAITREIVARHHGVIDVQSTTGQGSTFVVRLPIREEIGQLSKESTVEVVTQSKKEFGDAG